MSELIERIPKTPDMFDHLIGKGCGSRWMDYTWRDVILYALAVGADKYDLPYIYEHAKGGLKVLPTFGFLPYINSILMMPPSKEPLGPNELVSDFIVAGLGGEIPNRLHMAQELIIHNPIPAMKGSFITEDRVDHVYDWGDKGVVAVVSQEVMDSAGNPICTIRGTHYHKAFGNFGGEKYQAPKVAFPDRTPDYEATEFMAHNQAVLYRMLGDTYDVHINPDISGKYGYEMPFMQGLGTYGFAVRMAIQAVIPFQPERVTRLYAQIRHVCNPGQNVSFQGWKLEEGKVIFKLLSEKGELLLGNGIFEYR